MKVRDVMQAEVVTVRPDTNVQEVARLLTEHHIRSVPVIDEQQRVIGIISESDLFLKEKGIPFSAARLPTLFEKWVEPKQLEEIYKGVAHHMAADVMTEDVVCVEPEDSISHAAMLLLQRDIRSMPVVQEKKLVGIVSRVDFVRLLAKAE